MGGSVLGGRWSDRVLRQLKARNGGHGYPEVKQNDRYYICRL